MKNIYSIAGTIMILAMGAFIVLNYHTNTTTSVTFYPGMATNMSAGILILFTAIWATAGYFLLVRSKILKLSEIKQKQSNVAEKAAIKVEENTDKIKALEAKVKTLEEALKKALQGSK